MSNNDTNNAKQQGTVKWFNATKGYGFISTGSGSDVFVHISAVERAGLRTLEDNQRVAYNLSEEKGRTSAVDLEII